jgi:2-phosphosulfolactate phosphatase
MKVDVCFSPAGLHTPDLQGRIVFVIDILRATTTICAALHHGAKAVIPVGSTEEALRLSQTIGSTDVLLAGEKNCVRIPGFQLGNSPLEMSEATVRGKTLITSTSNGTVLCSPARAPHPSI